MSIVVIGVNHRTGPLSLLERLTIGPPDLPKAVTGLAARDSLREVVVLSTCNRMEVYAVAERFHGAYADIRDFLCELGSLPSDELHPHLYSQHDEGAARHLFEVAAGLDSAVLGETRDPRPGPGRLAAGPRRRRRPLDARPAVPPRPQRRQAGAHRDGDQPRHVVDQPRRRGDGVRPPRRPVRAQRARRRRRRDGRRGRHRAAQGRGGRDHGVQPQPAPWQPTRRPRRWPGDRPRPPRRRARRRRRRGRLHGVGRERGHPRRRRRQPPPWVAAARRRHRGPPLGRPLGRGDRGDHAARPRRPPGLGRSRRRPARGGGRAGPRAGRHRGRAVLDGGRRPPGGAAGRRAPRAGRDGPQRRARPLRRHGSPSSTTTSGSPSTR